MVAPTIAPMTILNQPACVPGTAALEVLLVLEADLVLVGAPDEVLLEEAEVFGGVLPLVGAAVAPARGAVDCPLIWSRTAGLKVPVIPDMVNLAEKARAGNWGLAGSFKPRDSIRMKYSLLFGPIDASGVNWIDWVVDTSTLAMILWRRVCCWALPA